LSDGLASFEAAALDLGFELLSEGIDVGGGRWVAVGFFGALGGSVWRERSARTLLPRSRTRVPNISSVTDPDSFPAVEAGK